MVERIINGVEVTLGELFSKEWKYYPEKDKLLIKQFIYHLQHFGFIGLEGRNKPSDDVHKNDPQFIEKVRYAQTHKLWHYHIGILAFDMNKAFGDRTSEYVLHYQKLSSQIKIVDYSAHPPFRLPTLNYLS